MRKIAVILIIALLIIGFGWLVFYGLRYSRGVPVVVEEKVRQVLEVPFIEEKIDLAKGISPEIWQKLPEREVELVYQVTVLPWPQKGLISPITVKAFHNKKDIYFYIRWKDETEDYILTTNKFSDGCAIMFPLGKKIEPNPSTLLMGFLGKANIWHWKASIDREFWLNDFPEDKVYVDFYYPFEKGELFPISKDIPKSAVRDLLAIRVGTITPKETQQVQGKGVWNAGVWEVVFRRSLNPADVELDAIFPLGKKQYCAFAIWNGSKGDRGGRKSISDWVELKIR
ncbi:MAG: ethylbenzene dehydrogenase-related protein [Candidatus Omnitrophota bacterium]